MVIRSTHVEAPPLDTYEDAAGQRSFGLDEDEDEHDEPMLPEPEELEEGPGSSPTLWD